MGAEQVLSAGNVLNLEAEASDQVYIHMCMYMHIMYTYTQCLHICISSKEDIIGLECMVYTFRDKIGVKSQMYNMQ